MKGIHACVATWKGTKHLLVVLAAALTSSLGWSAADATTVAPLTFDDTVRQADAIVVGTVAGHRSRWEDSSRRWMLTDYTLTVEDVVYPSEQGLPIAKTIVLTYWGGTIGNETQAASDVRVPVDGERLVVMLHSQWVQGGTIAPTVGFDQGLLTVGVDAGSGKQVVRDANGQPLQLTASGKLLRGGATAGTPTGATTVDLKAFTAWLRANIPSIKRSPGKPKAAVDPDDPRLIRTFAKTPSLTDLAAPDPGWLTANSAHPELGPAAETGAGVPAAPSVAATKYALATELLQPMAIRTDAGPPGPKWSSAHQAHLPIVVNQFPASFAPWSPEDQYLMSRWNYYAHDVFHVYVTPTGTFGWPNGRFDLDGWPSDATMVSVYGAGWYCGAGCTTLGITWSRYDGGGWIIEADIALNPAASWTLDDEWVFDGSASKSFRQTMIHEMGHMHGLSHNFGSLALMNYFQPSYYRYFGLPFADDAAGIRWEYSANAVAVTDLAVYLFYESGVCFDGTNFYTCIYDATFPANLSAGNSFSVNYYHVENVGTTTIATPTIEWYLTAARNFNSAYYYLGTTTYPSLASFSYFFPSSVTRALSIPGSVPAGNYYLSAYIRSDGGAGQASFPFSNNYGFSRTTTHVKALASTGLVSSANPSAIGASVTFTATVTGSNPTGTVAFTADGVTLCGSVAVNASYKAACTTSTLTAGTHSIVAAYGGNANNTASTSPTLSQVVSKAVSATSLTSSANPSTVGATVTFTATVTGSNTTGPVTFTDGGATLCGGVTLNASHQAACTTSVLTVGTHSVVATYAGDTNNAGSTSPTLSQGVNKAASATGLTSSANPSTVGAMVTFTATVTGLNTTGPVTFTDGGATICGGVALNASHQAACTTSALTAGTRSIVATYGGDANNTGSTSPTLSQVVRVRRDRDYNADARGDVLWQSTGIQTAIWLMNGLGYSTYATINTDFNWVVTYTGDLSGDGRTDLVWRNLLTGQTAIWLMNGLAPTSSAIVLSDPTWQVVGTGDLNGDGKTDLIWRSSVTGQTAIWLMNGLTPTSSAIVLSDPTWQVVGTGDFNGDGKADLIWRSSATGQTAIWLMNGLASTAGAVVLSDPNWAVQRTGDLDGNGTSDLIWRNGVTGQTAVWLMNGLVPTSGAVVHGDPNWQVTATGDFNGDGRTDLVWSNASAGQTAIWLMSGLASTGAVIQADPNWSVTYATDTNGDGKSDLVWRNGATGQHVIWQMNGVVMTSYANLLGDPNWSVRPAGGGP